MDISFYDFSLPLGWIFPGESLKSRDYRKDYNKGKRVLWKMDEKRIKKSFQLVKEDIGDLYNKIAELGDKVEEMRVAQVSLADKIVKKANKREIKKTGKNQ